MPFSFRGLQTYCGTWSYHLGALRPHYSLLMAEVSAADLGGTRSGRREAERLALARPVQGQVLHPDQLIGHEVYWLATANHRLNNIGGEVGQAKNAREIGAADAIHPCQIGD